MSEGFCWAAGDCTARGKETAFSTCRAEGCLLGFIVLGIRLIFIWAKMYIVLLLLLFPRPGRHFYYDDDRSHSSGSCTELLGDLPVDFLPGRALCF